MLQFPVFEALEVRDYQLYPDRNDEPGLSIKLIRGPWIVLGVNGLGKSTLLLLLKHLVTGPVQLRAAGFTGERSDLISLDTRFFSARVNDAATNATGQVSLRFGNTSLQIKRQLSNLRPIEVIISKDGKHRTLNDEQEYRSALSSMMGVSQFEDALRILDRVIFFLEDRQPLIWDVSAQFELFRALLTPEISQELRRLEGEIVSNDSSARNLNAALYKLINRRSSELAKTKSLSDTHARLAKASAELEVAENKQNSDQNWTAAKNTALTPASK